MTGLTVDPFTLREFSVEELTTLINVVPNMYTLVTQLGVFGGAPIPLTETYVGIEINNGVLNLLPTTERGGPASKGSVGKRKRKLIEIPQVAHEDMITGAELQNLKGFGSAAPMMFEDKVMQKLGTMAGKHYLTMEWHRVGALAGKILDADGTTLLDLFTEFGVTQLEVPFGGASSIGQYCRDVKRHIEDNLNGEVMTGVAALCSPEFFDMLLEDADTKAAYNAAAAMMRLNPNIDDVRPMFLHQGILFLEYRGSASYLNAAGTVTTRKFIAANDARFFPLGTRNTAYHYTAPADFIDTVNTFGQLMYAREKMGDYNRWREYHTQSNCLPLWTRPELLVRGHTGSSN